MSIITRAGKGSKLTHAELDGNFTNLDERLEALETGGVTPEEISHATRTGTTVTLVGDEGSELGSFSILQFTSRGNWVAETDYTAGDYFSAGGKLWLTLTDFTSGTSFDDTNPAITPLIDFTIPAITPQGAWDIDTAYSQFDGTSHGGRLYGLLADTDTGTEPGTDPAVWQDMGPDPDSIDTPTTADVQLQAMLAFDF
ncbi:MAG: hypothetical protein Alpg2KO_00830 [Alphaproteobacteria bacterium]